MEILEKELADSGARVADLEADAATVQVRRPNMQELNPKPYTLKLKADAATVQVRRTLE